MAVMGDYPTLRDIDAAYGRGFSTEWLIPNIDNLSLYTGAKNITEDQQYFLADIIAKEYQYLKITELLLFFHRFKTGRYGRFYGSFDPMVITCALRDFMAERNELIDRYTHELWEERESHLVKMNRKEWEEYKRMNDENQKNKTNP